MQRRKFLQALAAIAVLPWLPRFGRVEALEEWRPQAVLERKLFRFHIGEVEDPMSIQVHSNGMPVEWEYIGDGYMWVHQGVRAQPAERDLADTIVTTEVGPTKRNV